MIPGTVLVHKPTGETYTYEFTMGHMLAIKSTKTGSVIYVTSEFMKFYEVTDILH